MGRALPVCLVLVVAAGLGSCGRRGPLELPPGSPPSTLRDQTTGEQTRILEDRDQPGLIQSRDQYYEKSAAAKQEVLKQLPAPPPINRPPETRKSTFLLDPLL